MQIIYIIITLMLFISAILIKKSDKEQNILFWVILTLVSGLAYNVLCGFLLLLINAKANLTSLSVINLVISILLIIKILKDKEIQKYYIKVKDIIALIILLVVIIAIAYKQYGFPFSVKYSASDPAIHFSVAKEIYEEKGLKWNCSMPGASLNTAILFDTFSFIFAEQDFYYLFIIFDLFVLYLIGAMFYIGICNKEKGIVKSIVALIFSILLICGYPLNSILFGFSYLTVGILMMVAILLLAPHIKSKEISNVVICIYMFLLNLGIFFSYYFFVPIIYASLGLYMLFNIIKNRKNKKIRSIFTIKNIFNVLVILILPTIIGFVYFILPSLISGNELEASHIGYEGFIYRDLVSNFIFLAPLVLFFFLDRIKNKKICITNITFIITMIFTAMLFILGLKDIASAYYYYKTYFLISILVMIMSVKSIYKLIDNKLQIYAYSYIFVYIAILIAVCFKIENRINFKKPLFCPNIYLYTYVDIYNGNLTVLKGNGNILTNEQIKAIDFLLEHEEDKSKIEVYGNFLQRMWTSNIGKITETDDMLILQHPVEFDLEKWIKNDEKQYYICFNIPEEINKESAEYKIIYEVEGAIILEKNK